MNIAGKWDLDFFCLRVWPYGWGISQLIWATCNFKDHDLSLEKLEYDECFLNGKNSHKISNKFF